MHYDTVMLMKFYPLNAHLLRYFAYLCTPVSY